MGMRDACNEDLKRQKNKMTAMCLVFSVTSDLRLREKVRKIEREELETCKILVVVIHWLHGARYGTMAESEYSGRYRKSSVRIKSIGDCITITL